MALLGSVHGQGASDGLVAGPAHGGGGEGGVPGEGGPLVDAAGAEHLPAHPTVVLGGGGGDYQSMTIGNRLNTLHTDYYDSNNLSQVSNNNNLYFMFFKLLQLGYDFASPD